MPIGTNAGKDNFGTSGLDEYIKYAAVQTGTTSFDATTTTLNGEVLRTSGNGGFSETTSYSTVTGTPDYLRRERTFYRVFNITSAYNLTGFGLTPSSSGGTMSIVGAFRTDPNDEMSSAVTISVVNGDQLQLIFKDIIDLPYELETGTCVVTGTAGKDSAGTYDTNSTFYNVNGSSYDNYIFTTFNPAAVSPYACLMGASGSTGINQLPSLLANKSSSRQSYTSGNYYRDYTCTFSTSEANGTIYGFAQNGIVIASTIKAGFKTHFTNPTNFTKSNTETLVIKFRTSWDWV